MYYFVIYHNPSYNNGAVYLQTNFMGEINFHLFDMEGRVIHQELISVNGENVNLIKNINLPPGVYPVVISSFNNKFIAKTFKLIVK